MYSYARTLATFSFALIFVAAVIGCGQRKRDSFNEENKSKAIVEPYQQGDGQKEDHPMHGGHTHAFADPEEQSKKWNDPDRDKWQRPEEIVAALALKPGANVADIGAGTGYMVAPLSKVVGQDGTIFAIDSSPHMIKYLEERSAELGPAKIVPREVGADDPELPAATVDAVLTLDTWHHVDGRQAYAKKVYAGLKPGGRFVVVDYDVDAETGPPQAMRLAPEQVTKQLEAAGFRVETVKESMPRHYIVVGFKE
jgi:predicted methyltransferase